MKGHVLVVDNEKNIRSEIGRVLEIHGYHWEEADGFQSAQEKLRANEFDVLLTDKNIPIAPEGNEGGMELIRWARRVKPDLPTILMTAHPTVDSALEALRLGAFDYLLKPLELKLLAQKVDRACEFRKHVNPEAVLDAYLNLSRTVLDAVGANAMDIDARIASLQDCLNNLFQNYRTVEHALLDHRQFLAEIAAYAMQAREKLPDENPACEMLQHIADKAAQRL
jgi:DNA-binding NtrC family response regulator